MSEKMSSRGVADLTSRVRESTAAARRPRRRPPPRSKRLPGKIPAPCRLEAGLDAVAPIDSSIAAPPIPRISHPGPRTKMKNPSVVARANFAVPNAGCQNCGKRLNPSAPKNAANAHEEDDQLKDDGDVGRQAEHRLAADPHGVIDGVGPPLQGERGDRPGDSRRQHQPRQPSGPDAHRPLHAVDREGAHRVPAAKALVADSRRGGQQRLRARRSREESDRAHRPRAGVVCCIPIISHDRTRKNRPFPCRRKDAKPPSRRESRRTSGIRQNNREIAKGRNREEGQVAAALLRIVSLACVLHVFASSPLRPFAISR